MSRVTLSLLMLWRCLSVKPSRLLSQSRPCSLILKATFTRISHPAPFAHSTHFNRRSIKFMSSVTNVTSPSTKSNPLLEDWSLEPFGLPPFSRVNVEHFKPAFDVAIAAHISELEAIAAVPDEKVSFETICVAFDRAGEQMSRISKLFSNLCSSNAPPALQAVELQMAGPLAAHENRIYTLPNLFSRIDSLYSKRAELNLQPEALRLVERLHLDFVRAGARFSPADQKQYGEITEKLAALTTQFTQNVLADEEEFVITLKLEDLSGCPPDLITAAKQAADERQRPADDYVITLSRSLAVPFLTYSTRRDLREKVFTTWCRRGELNAARDNRKMAVQILDLRAQQAQMHGYESYAAYAVADTMASRPDAVAQLLERVWTPATASANNEREQLQAFAASAQAGEEGLKDSLQAWDWRFYAERLRQARYDFDEATLKPYLSLERITEAAFDCANRLYGLRYVPRPDIQGYHPDVKVYEVRETTEAGVDRLVAVFLADNFARPHKRGGAWMSDLRSQSRNSTDASGKLDITDGDRIVPIILNNNNFCKAPPGQPTLLSFDDGVTLFHEFGHSLHGVLSDAKYNRLAGTNVLSDFVELPSQLMEHWFSAPRVMRQHARHFETDEPISEEMLQRLKAARCFNQGFQTVEYTASALLDQRLHALTRAELENLDMDAFEQQQMSALGMPAAMVPRHRPAHFAHLFSSSQYAAQYYVYLWAEILDADAYEAFEETGDIFDAATAALARKCIYAAGNTVEPGATFAAFRGRAPVIEPMLRKKGLL